MKIKSRAIPFNIPGISTPTGWGNGYVGVPKEHPWYGKDYDDIEANVHGGLTYSADHFPRKKSDEYWWVGFDTSHYMDNAENCSKIFVEKETKRLKEQAIEACKKEY